MQAALLLAMAIALAVRGYGVEAFGWAALVASGAGLGWTVAAFVGRFGPFRLRVDLPFQRSLLRQAWPLALGFACTTVYYYADSVLLGAMGRTREVGWYGAAYVFLLGAVLLIGALRNAYFPSLSRAVHGDPQGRLRLLRQYGRLTAMLALPLAFAGPLAAGPLVRLVYGQEFAPATAALRILFVTGGVMCFSSYCGAELLATNGQRAYVTAVAVGAGVNLLLNAAFIPPFSQNGAAVATLIAETTVCAFLWSRTRGRGLPLPAPLVDASFPAAILVTALLGGLLLLPEYSAFAVAGLAYVAALGVWEWRPGLRRGACAG